LFISEVSNLTYLSVNIGKNRFHYLAPLGAFVKGGEKLVDGLSVHLDQRLSARARLVDLGEGGDGVSYDLGNKC
jgi:hypothetical protein